MEWTNEEIFKFIELYQNEPMIWDPKHRHHKNNFRVSDAWTRMGDIMKVPVDELKTKRNSLMATFRLHLRRKKPSIQSGANVDDVYKPIWFAYMEKFLACNYECEETINTEETTTTSPQEQTDADEDASNYSSTSIQKSQPTLRQRQKRRYPPSEIETAQKNNQ